MRRRAATLLSLLTAVLGDARTLAPHGGSVVGGEPPRSLAFAIGNGNLKGSALEVGDRLGAFDLVVIDGRETRSAEVAAIQAHGATVLGYLSVGTIEKWRPWYRKVKRFRLNAWQDWREEWFADVSRPRLRRFISRRIAPKTLGKGFGGLFLDNVDMVSTRGHRHQRKGMRRLVRKLARLSHDQGRLLFAQNGHGIVDQLGIVEDLDGWNREDVTAADYAKAADRYTIDEAWPTPVRRARCPTSATSGSRCGDCRTRPSPAIRRRLSG